MHKNQIVWEPLKESYTYDEMPQTPDSISLVWGKGLGPMLAILEPVRQGGPFIAAVTAQFSYYPALDLGYTHMAVVKMPEGFNQEPTTEQLEQMAHRIMQFYLPNQTDGQLVSLRNAYRANADTRRSGQPLQHVGPPFNTYPAEVFDLCESWVVEEIGRRTASPVLEAKLSPNPIAGFAANVQEHIDGTEPQPAQIIREGEEPNQES